MTEANIKRLFTWFGISIVVGTGFNIVWAIIFWNSNLFVWHNLAAPIAMMIMAYGGIRSLFCGR